MEFVIIVGLLILVVIVLVISITTDQNRKKRSFEEVKAQMQARVDRLKSKYPDTEIHDKLIGRTVWIGETKEMLIDSMGPPLDIDTKVMKSKTKEVIKYNQTGANRYGTKINLEDGIVVGWDVK